MNRYLVVDLNNKVACIDSADTLPPWLVDGAAYVHCMTTGQRIKDDKKANVNLTKAYPLATFGRIDMGGWLGATEGYHASNGFRIVQPRPTQAKLDDRRVVYYDGCSMHAVLNDLSEYQYSPPPDDVSSLFRTPGEINEQMVARYRAVLQIVLDSFAKEDTAQLSKTADAQFDPFDGKGRVFNRFTGESVDPSIFEPDHNSKVAGVAPLPTTWNGWITSTVNKESALSIDPAVGDSKAVVVTVAVEEGCEPDKFTLRVKDFVDVQTNRPVDTTRAMRDGKAINPPQREECPKIDLWRFTRAEAEAIRNRQQEAQAKGIRLNALRLKIQGENNE